MGRLGSRLIVMRRSRDAVIVLRRGRGVFKDLRSQTRCYLIVEIVLVLDLRGHDTESAEGKYFKG